jgi:hypothetical protein
MRESRTYGFVRGVLGDQHPYRDRQNFAFELSLSLGVGGLAVAGNLQCSLQARDFHCHQTDDSDQS